MSTPGRVAVAVICRHDGDIYSRMLLSIYSALYHFLAHLVAWNVFWHVKETCLCTMLPSVNLFLNSSATGNCGKKPAKIRLWGDGTNYSEMNFRLLLALLCFGIVVMTYGLNWSLILTEFKSIATELCLLFLLRRSSVEMDMSLCIFRLVENHPKKLSINLICGSEL